MVTHKIIPDRKTFKCIKTPQTTWQLICSKYTLKLWGKSENLIVKSSRFTVKNGSICKKCG